MISYAVLFYRLLKSIRKRYIQKIKVSNEDLDTL